MIYIVIRLLRWGIALEVSYLAVRDWTNYINSNFGQFQSQSKSTQLDVVILIVALLFPLPLPMVHGIIDHHHQLFHRIIQVHGMMYIYDVVVKLHDVYSASARQQWLTFASQHLVKKIYLDVPAIVLLDPPSYDQGLVVDFIREAKFGYNIDTELIFFIFK
jgi:hypothetical protein